MIVWLIGMSGAGKTTVGRIVYEELKAKRDNVVFLDGDILRDVWGDSLGHHVEGRAMNAHRISHLCRMLDRQGIHVIAAVLSIFPEWQEWNRQNFSSYFQVHLDVPYEVLKARDSKGLYSSAEAGTIKNVVGVDIPFPAPTASNLTISGHQSVEPAAEIAQRILSKLPFDLGPAA